MKNKSTRSTFKLLIILAVLMITGCQSNSRYKITHNLTASDLFNDAFFEPIDPLISIDQVFKLTPKQEQDFFKAYNSFSYRSLSGSERIYKYLQNKLQNFNFHAETLTATESLSQDSGNCLSLAIVTRALAKLVKVGTKFELARTDPVFQLENNIQLTSRHIRTVVYVNEIRNTKQYVNPNYKIRIDYFPSYGSRTLRTVKKEEFFAMYYINRAAEAIIKGQNNQAYWLVKKALLQQPHDSTAINMLGVLYQRKNHLEAAEKVFTYGLALQTGQLELLNNYHKLLTKMERFDEASLIAAHIKSHNNKDPFNWIDLANKELHEKNYSTAINYFNKAIELADYLHQPYAGIAQANYYLGRKNRALDAIELAITNTKHFKTKSIYQIKFDQIKSILD